VLPAAGVRVGAFLCLESMFPQDVRAVAQAGAEVLANLSNDSWFGQPGAMRQQLDSAALRAVENRRYLVRAASTGYSAVVDPHGRIVAQSGRDAPQILQATVRGSRARTPYQRCGDAFAWAVIAGVGVTMLRQRSHRRHPQPATGRNP
jgi:apolipoprotein N-acyltransferase